jgi:hypothetical protein
MIEPLVALLARVGGRFIGLDGAVYLSAAVKNLTNDEPTLVALATAGLSSALAAALAYQCMQRSGGCGGVGGVGAADGAGGKFDKAQDTLLLQLTAIARNVSMHPQVRRCAATATRCSKYKHAVAPMLTRYVFCQRPRFPRAGSVVM